MLNSKILVGVSVTPGVGLEVAQIDCVSRVVLKYGVRPLEYDVNRREIADLDIFREALQDLFIDLQIPKGSEVVINIPTVVFKTNDYPASLNEPQIMGAIEEELAEHYILRDSEVAISATALPGASTQLVKVGYTAAQKTMLVEMALIVKELGYKLYAIDSSISSSLNALILNERVDIQSDSWVLLLVENSVCRAILMSGASYVDAIEERISIGEVLDDADNYVTVINAVQPILKRIPSKYLCVVSKTDVISAEVLASKLKYSSPIIHQEANSYAKEQLIEIGPAVDSNLARRISLDVIGASAYKMFERHFGRNFNLYNYMLGDVYTMEQPPEINFLGNRLVLTNGKVFGFFIFIAIVIAALVFGAYTYYATINRGLEENINQINADIEKAEKFLKDNEHVSSNLFNEGDEIRIGLIHNKRIYSYYSIVGTEIPKKLWLTELKLGGKVTIAGQADNLESVYSFFRNIKDYEPNSGVKLQKLGLASSSQLQPLDEKGDFDTDSVLTSLNADYYEFKISDEKESLPKKVDKKNTKKKSTKKKKSAADLEPIE